MFQTYHSLLDRHPLLRTYTPQGSSPLFHTASADSVFLLADDDLKPLKRTAVMKYLSDNSARVCQYELPGGGECRDKNCESVHLSRLSTVEPSGMSIFTSTQVANLFIASPALYSLHSAPQMRIPRSICAPQYRAVSAMASKSSGRHLM